MRDRKELIERIEIEYPGVADFVEGRLHSHTESSNKMILERLDRLDKAVADVKSKIDSHDEILNGETFSILVKMAKAFKESEDFQKVGTRYIKKAGIIAALISSLYVIKMFLGSIIVFLTSK